MNIIAMQDKNQKQIKNTLLFVNTGQIGDLVISSLILENDKLFENSDCYLLIDKKFNELFSTYKGNVKIITFNKTKYRYLLLYRIKMIKILRKLNINKAYNITATRGFVNDEITLLSGGREFYSTSSDSKYLGKFILNKFNKMYNAILLNEIYNEYEKTVNIISNITGASISDIVVENNKTFRINKNIVIKNDYITISPFASNEIKNWGETNYKYLIEEISKSIKVFLLGSKKQRKILEKLKNNFENVECVTCTLEEIPQIIYNSLFFVGNDSGLTHIAYRLGKPVVAVIGGGCYRKFLPFRTINKHSIDFVNNIECIGCDWNCKYPEPYCLTRIDKHTVLKKILYLLNNITK